SRVLTVCRPRIVDFSEQRTARTKALVRIGIFVGFARALSSRIVWISIGIEMLHFAVAVFVVREQVLRPTIVERQRFGNEQIRPLGPPDDPAILVGRRFW